MLPDGDGIEVLRALRREGIRTPVLVLTARSSTAEKVTGLRAGADDYLAKPFAFEELLARLEALHRRSEGTLVVRTVGDVTLDGKRRALRAPGAEVELTGREYALAAELFEHAGEVRTRAQLLLDVWGNGFEGDPNILDVYVGYLRQKLARLEGPGRRVPAVRAVRGVGFRLRLEEGA
jgi:DNA-binding response OmpR family regulator